uniref:NADH dehydrogenase subunit 6 n=1 Tax=Scoparipes salvazai TaxID=2575669 RepID=A0A4D6X065_9HEMI|nr:NADH dehydrogenase subunit 6 [Scoparipes salvazai]QCI09219.1 NADH dehydrogenase subunit 6 [Scoparipes salvazai]
MMTLLTLMTSLSIMFLWLNHPLSMGLVLICQTLIIAMITGMKLSSFLMSYIIIIIILSGALVLFIYMASIASNEKFQTPIKMIILFLIINGIVLGASEFFNMKSYSMLALQIKPEQLFMIKLFSTTTAYITSMMILYLFLTMIAVSNIASVYEGPLRMKSYEQTN